MSRFLRSASIFIFLAYTFSAGGLWAAGAELTGEQVAAISKIFLRNHYSRATLDDEHSKRILKKFINRFDPGHYYFLQSDIDKFQQYSDKLDNYMLSGDIGPIFVIFETYKRRINEREATINKLLAGPFDLESDDSTLLDRADEPFPKDQAEVERLWAKKLKFEMLERVLSGDKEKEAREALRRRYDSTRLQIRRYSRNEVLTALLNTLTTSYDPHSTYLSPDDLENFNISLRLSLEGIGATLRWEDGLTVVTSIIPGGAAWRQGSLERDDRIIQVAQGKKGVFEDVRNMRLIDVVKRIRGKRGTMVRLRIQRKAKGVFGKPFEIAIVRDKIILKEGEASGKVIDQQPEGKVDPRRIGVIKLPSFYVDFSQRSSKPDSYKSSSRDVEKILQEFLDQKVDGVILDLRNNGGGGLQEAVSLSGLFLEKGPVVMVKTVRGRIETYSNPHSRPVYRGPLLILTNRYSASASEILAGAMQDYGRAIIVGESSTFGKGTVQNIIQLPKGLGALKTTVAKFYRPGSSSTQSRGVVPDIVLPSLNNHLDIGEAAQENALPWDSVRRASYKPWSDLSPLLPVLARKSQSRRQKDPDFQKVRERVKEYLENEKDRKVLTVLQMIERSKENGKPHNQELQPEAKEKEGEGESEGETLTEVNDFFLDEVVDIMADYLKIVERRSQGQMVGGRG